MKYFLLALSIIIANLSFSQKLDWSNPIGGSSPDWGNAVCSDAYGNVYYAGEFQGIVDFDPSGATDFLNSYGNKDGFLVKFDSDGNYQWALNVGGVDIDAVTAVDLDTDGNVYIAGYSRQTAYFNSANLDDTLITAGGADIFIAKYDPNGNYQWAFNVGGSTNDVPTAMDIDENNSIYLTGSYGQGATDFDPGPSQFILGTYNASYDLFVAKYDIDQNFFWAFGVGLASYDEAKDISVDENGNVYIVGGMGGNPDFDPGPGVSNISSQGGVEGFLSKYDSLGNHQWAIGFGSAGTDVAYGVNAGTSGNVYVTGYFEQAADFDPSISSAILSSNGGRDAFIARYDQNGGYVSAYNYGDTGDDYGRGISQDADNNQYFIGDFEGTVDFDAEVGVNNLTSNGGADVYVLKLDYTMNFEWAFNIGGSITDQGYAIDGTDGGEVNITGYYRGLVDFDPGPGVDQSLATAGSTDILIAQYFQCGLISSNVNVDICQGDSLFLEGAYRTTAGTFYDTLAAVNTCDSVVVTQLSILTTPTVDAGIDYIICDGDSVIVNGSGAVSYTWDNGVIDGSYFHPLTTLTYTVTGTGSNGCIDTNQMVVTVNALPNVDAGVDNALCVGDAIILSGTGADTYDWDNSVLNGVAFNPIATLTYIVAGTDLNGCVNTDTIIVTVNQLPAVNAGVDITVCDGQMITLSGSGAANYVWDNGVTDGVSFTAVAATYTVTGTDINGCVNQDLVIVSLNTLPVVLINPFNSDTVCLEGGAVVLPAATPSGGDYSGSGVSVPNFDPSVSGVGLQTIIYSYTDANGCTNSESTNIQVVSCAGIDEFDEASFILYPNPNTGCFNIQFKQDLGTAEIRIYDAAGKTIQLSVEQITAGTVIPFDLSDKKPGIYLLIITTDKGVLQQKIVVE